MLRHFLLRLALLLLPLGASFAQGNDTSAAAFEQELERVQRKMENSDWKVALRRLDGALQSHEGGDYVLQHLGEIELALKRCHFWNDRGKVDLSGGFAGEFDYDLRTGKVELNYKAGAKTDFEKQGFALVLPVIFSGPYSVELSDGPDPTIIVCAKGQQSVSVNYSRVFHLGVGNPNHKKPTQRTVEMRAQLRERDGDLIDETKSKDFTSKRKLKERKYKVSVTGNVVKCTFNGKSLLSRSKPKELWGQVAFALTIPDSDIEIKGEAKSWLRGRLDAAVAEDWKKFEKQWKLEPHLPPWMRASLESKATKPTTTSEGSQPSAGITPAELPQQDIETWNAAVKLLEGEKFAEALEEIDGLLTRAPQLAEGYRLQANAHMQLRDRAAAAGALQRGVAAAPGNATLRKDLTETLLLTGRFQESLDAIASAIAAGFPPADFQPVSITANKALHGPAWSAKNEYSSRHYTVASDLSKEVCRKVALELEETFRHVSRRMKLGSHIETHKFQVYVFSGRARYNDYISDVFRGTGESTLGMYSSYLKQLLILDSADTEMLMHTVRHEGFHQLLDTELEEPPSWLNEGLAEYFAAARTKGGSWKDGQLNAPRLEVLQGRYRGKLLPLASFLYQDHTHFMKNATLGYSQGWAFVHFLRHSTRENQASFDALLTALQAGKTNRQAIDAAFEGRDLEKLDSEFASFVLKL